MNNKSNDDKIKEFLARDKHISLILYILSEIPSYPDELTKALQLPDEVVRNTVLFLRNNKLIRELNINEELRNGVVREFYPILLQKQKKAVKGLSKKDVKKVLENINFYFISQKGLDFLPDARKRIFQKGGGKNGK